MLTVVFEVPSLSGCKRHHTSCFIFAWYTVVVQDDEVLTILHVPALNCSSSCVKIARSTNMRIHRLKEYIVREKKRASGMTNRVSASAVRRGTSSVGREEESERCLWKGLSGQRKENSACQSA